MLSSYMRRQILLALLSRGNAEIGDLARATMAPSERRIRLDMDLLKRHGYHIVNTGYRTFSLV